MDFVVYVYDRNEVMAAVLQNHCNVAMRACVHNERARTCTLVLADHCPRELQISGFIGFYNVAGLFEVFTIRRIKEIHTKNGLECTVYAEHILNDLREHWVESLTVSKGEDSSVLLWKLLKGTFWMENSFIIKTTPRPLSFAGEHVLSCIERVAEELDADISCEIQTNGNRLGRRTVILVPRLPRESGKRFAWGKDILSVTRNVDTDKMVTALYGLGKTVKAAGVSTQTNFASVSWNTPGNPVSKPVGQLWVGDDGLIDQWGIGIQGQKKHRFGLVQFSMIEDPEELLEATWNAFLKRNHPSVEYTVKAIDLERISGFPHEAIRLNHVVHIIDDVFDPPLELTGIIREIERDYIHPEQTFIQIQAK